MTAAQPPAYPEASQASTALVLSILGLLCCIPLAVVGWIMANNELQGIGAGRRDPSNEGTANAARIVGMVATVLWGLALAAGVILFFAGLAVFPFQGT